MTLEELLALTVPKTPKLIKSTFFHPSTTTYTCTNIQDWWSIVETSSTNNQQLNFFDNIFGFLQHHIINGFCNSQPIIVPIMFKRSILDFQEFEKIFDWFQVKKRFAFRQKIKKQKQMEALFFWNIYQHQFLIVQPWF